MHIIEIYGLQRSEHKKAITTSFKYPWIWSTANSKMYHSCLYLNKGNISVFAFLAQSKTFLSEDFFQLSTSNFCLHSISKICVKLILTQLKHNSLKFFVILQTENFLKKKLHNIKLETWIFSHSHILQFEIITYQSCWNKH